MNAKLNLWFLHFSEELLILKYMYTCIIDYFWQKKWNSAEKNLKILSNAALDYTMHNLR